MPDDHPVTGRAEMDDESGGWLTYQEAGDRLGVSPEAARAKAARKRWRRQIGNDGRARVWLPAGEHAAGDRQVTTRAREPGEPPVITRSPRAHHPVDPALVISLESHIKTLQGENEATKEQLAEARARLAAAETLLEKQAAELTDRTAQHAADLVAERATTEKAIAAFSALADRLDALTD